MIKNYCSNPARYRLVYMAERWSCGTKLRVTLLGRESIMTNFILRKHRAMFVHIPKTGGTSVKDAFGGIECQFFGHIPREFRNLPSFAIVREPQARFLSAFRMFKYGNLLPEDYYSIPRLPDLTIKDALDVLEDPWIGFDRSERSLLWNLKHHMIPQTHPFNCLHFARSKLRLETINVDFAQFVATTNLTAELPQFRGTRGKQLEDEYWSPIDKERFSRIFEEDYKVLGYSPDCANAPFRHAARPYTTSQGSTDMMVYEIWSAYFSDKIIAVNNADTALPAVDCPLVPLADEIIPGEGNSKAWAGRSKDLIGHFRRLQPEFAGASRLSHLLACLIVVLRRDAENERALKLFWRILDEQFDVIRSEISLRWLISIADTIADFGRNTGECAIGLSASVYANTAKLYETEQKIYHPKRPWPPKKRLNSGGELFDGMISYWIEEGDLIENMFARSVRISKSEPVAGKVLMEVIERLKKGPTVYRRFNRISGKTSVPILDTDTRIKIERLAKKAL